MINDGSVAGLPCLIVRSGGRTITFFCEGKGMEMTGIGWLNLIANLAGAAGMLYLLPLGINYELRILLFYGIVQLMVGRYRNNVLLIWDEIRLIIISHCWFFVGVLLFFKICSLSIVLWLLVLALTTALMSIVFARYSRIWLRKLFKKNVLVIGIGHTAEKLWNVCRGNRFSLMDVRGFISCNDTKRLPTIYQQEEVVKEHVYSFDDMEEVILKEKIQSVIIAIPQIHKKDLEQIVAGLRNRVKEIKVLPSFNNLVTFDTRVDDFDGLLLISTAQTEINIWVRLGKRILDICGGIAGCLVLLPLYFYVRRKNHQSGDYDPVFFKQKRIGKNGKEFTIYKFRTMVPNAEKILDELMEKDPAIREEYTKNKKLKNDPRITKAGHFLRKTSLDEFPQFINVLKGDMSLIGPRPYLPREKEDMGIYYDIIIQMKPGLTGMWQTHGRSDVDFEDRLALDEYYYRNYNLWLDVTLLVKTVRTMLAGSHAGAM